MSEIIGRINPPKEHEKPDEIWSLRRPDGRLVPSMDEIGKPFLAFRSQGKANLSAQYHLEEYGIECEPVCLYGEREKRIEQERDSLIAYLDDIGEFIRQDENGQWYWQSCGEWIGTYD